MGFTAINTSAVPTLPLNASQHQPEMGTQQERSDSVAASYLGLGGSAADESFCKSAAKPARGRGKKRAATTTATPSTGKRRKGKDHDAPTASLNTRKEVVQSSSAASIDNTLSLTPSWPSEPAVAKTGSRPSMTRTNHVQEDMPSTDSVSLYTSTTSMSETNFTSQSTSMDAFKASSGYGCTIYTNSQRNRPDAKARVVEKGKQAVATISKRRNPRRMSAARVPRLSPVHEEENLMTPDVVHAKLPQPDIADEDFFGNDLSDDELIYSFPENIESSGSRRHSDSAQTNDEMAESKLKPPTSVHYDDDRPISKSYSAAKSQDQADQQRLSNDDEDFNVSDDLDDEAIEIVMSVEDMVAQQAKTPPPRTVKQNTRSVLEDEDYGGALLSESERQLLESVKSRVNDGPKPITRRPFPTPILDRSPIFGVSNATNLRTCFRVGETLNVGCDAVRHNKNVLIEFYARVTASWREEKPGGRQHLVFKDLYHDKPPYINGTFELCGQSALWDSDVEIFLKADNDGIMCRAIAQMKRDGTKWRASVLNIWEATWADVEYTAGIYARSESEVIEE